MTFCTFLIMIEIFTWAVKFYFSSATNDLFPDNNKLKYGEKNYPEKSFQKT